MFKFNYDYIKQKKFLSIITFISLIFIFSAGITYFILISENNDKITCSTFVENKKYYCKTHEIKIYHTNIKFPRSTKFVIAEDVINANCMDKKTINFLQESIKKKALRDAQFLFGKNKRELARLIIQYQNPDTADKNQMVYNMAKTVEIVRFIKKADKVKAVDYNIKLKFLGDTKIKYIAVYNSEIFNYYSDKGVLVYREYKKDGNTLRFQTFDRYNNFYTYDNLENLIVYSKDLNVYNSQKQILYKLHPEDKNIIRFVKIFEDKADRKRVYARETENSFVFYKRQPLLRELNNPNSTIYKDIVAVIDQYYDKGSSEIMIFELNKYFKELSKNNKELFYEYKKIMGDSKFTLNFGKYDDRYIFSINNSHLYGFKKIAASMADTLNRYGGKCAEPNLKAITKNKLIGKYFYDIKIIPAENSITFEEHVPCRACSINTSLWGWEYPFK